MQCSDRMCLRGGRSLAVAVVLALSPSRARGWDYIEQGRNWDHLGFCHLSGAIEKQSPIDLPMGAAMNPNGEGILLNYPVLDIPTQLYATGTSVALTLPEEYKGGFGIATAKKGNAEQIKELRRPGAKAFRLWQMEFHAPAEHTINGMRAPLELQLSHKRADSDEVSIISVLFEAVQGEQSRFLEAVIGRGLPSTEWKEESYNPANYGGLSIQALLEKQLFFEYEGSLTTPPCETGVRWLVTRETVKASMAQVTAFQSVMSKFAPPHGNFREIPTGTRAGDKVYIMPTTGIDKKTLDSVQSASTSGPSEQEEVISRVAASLTDDPTFKQVSSQDSPGLLKAKEMYMEARLNSVASNMAAVAARRGLRVAKDMYNAEAGLVGKIDQMWNVIVAKQGAQGAGIEAGIKRKEFTDASVAAAKLVTAEKAATQAPDIGAKPNTEGDHLEAMYSPRVSLPNGPAGNPFWKELAHHISISAKAGQTRSHGRLANNLKQPAATESESPVPEIQFVEPTEKPTPPPPPPQQIIIRLNVPADEVTKAKMLARDVTEAMVEGIDGQHDRVDLFEARRIAF